MPCMLGWSFDCFRNKTSIKIKSTTKQKCVKRSNQQMRTASPFQHMRIGRMHTHISTCLVRIPPGAPKQCSCYYAQVVYHRLRWHDKTLQCWRMEICWKRQRTGVATHIATVRRQRTLVASRIAAAQQHEHCPISRRMSDPIIASRTLQVEQGLLPQEDEHQANGT